MPNDTSPTKRALLIGIDEYTLQPAVIVPLSGCCNDVDLMRSILVDRYGFDPARITVLKNAEATRDGITAAFERLVAETGENDIVVVQYGGHGSQKWNMSQEEASGWDSTIVPVDSGRDPVPSTDITDKTISGWLAALGAKTPYTTLFFDSCHSGTITRDVFAAKARHAPPDARGAAKATTAGAGAGATPSRPATRGIGTGSAGPTPAPGERYVVISGCRDDETSWEYHDPQGVTHGALTYFLSQALQTPGRKSYRDVYEAIAPLVTAHKGQHPQMEGRADAEVLGTAVLPPMLYVKVTGPTADGTAIELEAGAGHRVTVGSEYDVFRPGAGTPNDADRLGRVRVTAVRAVTSDAVPVDGIAASEYPVHARAVETSHAYGDFRLGVRLDASVTSSSLPEAQAFVEALRRSRKVEIVDGGAGAGRAPGVVVYLVAPRSAAEPGDAVPRLGAVAAPTWVMADGIGEPSGPIKSLADHALVAENLDKLANWRDTLALENPDPASALHGKFAVQAMRRVPGAGAPESMTPEQFTWEPVTPDAEGRLVLDEGEFIGFRVTSAHPEPVFVNLVSLGFDGEVAVVYPRPSDSAAMLAPNGELNIRNWTRKGYRVTFSDAYPFVRSDAVGVVEGTDTVKLFVTTREARFDAVQQTGMRSVAAGAAPSMVERLLRRANDTAKPAERTRGFDAGPPPEAMTVPVKAEDWTTTRVQFVTRKRPASAGLAVAVAPVASASIASAQTVSTQPASTQARSALARAVADAGLRVQQTFEVAPPPADPAGGPLGTRSVPAASRVEVADPGPGQGQMLLATDPSGLVSWHFAPVPAETAASELAAGELAAGEPGTRAVGAPRPATRRYEIDAIVTPPAGAASVDGAPGQRGLLGAAARKLVEVVAFPLIQDGLSVLSERYVPVWEMGKHPYRIRSFTPSDYAAPGGRTVDGAELSAGPALLMVHGTFSSAHAAFGALDRATVERLHRQYGGRVFAFDHLTLSHDPRQNVTWLLEQLPDSAGLDVDIVCHSRGGLVSRMLAERSGELPRPVKVGRVVFVGSPNAGTTLADPEHMGAFLDTYTNLLSLVPTNGVTDVLEGILTVAKVLAVGVLSGLRGLQSMHPKGDFTRLLNAKDGAAAGDTRYFALSSDFTPRPDRPALSALLVNRLMDRVFAKARNDLVVPTDGVFAENGSGRFPIATTRVFDGADAVTHTEFFASDKARRQMLEWLGA